MNTWKIWRRLRNPSFMHPLFRRALTNRMPRPTSYEPPEYPLLNWRIFVELFAALFICSSMFSPVFMLLAFFGMVLLMNGTLYSTLWAVRTSGIIAGARQNQTYDLYCVAPEGALGTNLAICTGFLHRNNRLDQIYGLLRSMIIIALVTVALIALVLLSNAAYGQISPFAREEVRRSSVMLVHVLAVLALVYTDHIQSVVTGCLVSMVVPTFAKGRLDAQIGTLGVYFILQIAAYLSAWVFMLQVLPSLFSNNPSFMGQIILAILQVLTFYAIRETIISGLWQLLLRRLDVPPTDDPHINPPPFKLGLKLQ